MNRISPIDIAEGALSSEVGAALLVNVATSSGTVGFEDQFVPTFQLVPGPVQVPLVMMSPCCGLLVGRPHRLVD